MSADVLDALRAADPAASMPASTPEELELLRRAILATPLDSGLRPARRRTAHRRVLVAGIAGGLLLAGGGGVYAATVLLQPLPKGHAMESEKQIRQAYWREAHKLTLPAGARWFGPWPDPGVSASRREWTPKAAGAFDAVLEAWGNWALEWIAASKAGDGPRAAVAEAWVMRLWALVPITRSSDQAVIGMDPDSAAYWKAAIAQAKAGDFGTLRRLVRQDVPGLIKVEPYPTPTHFLGFTGSGYSSADAADGMKDYAITTDQAQAEYRAVMRTVGVPPGADLDVSRKINAAGSGVLANHYYVGDGFTQAFDDLWTAWWREWVAAAKAGDAQRIAAAEAATVRLQKLLPYRPTHHGRTITFALAAAPRRDLRRLSVEARKGDMRGVEQWVAFQDTYARIMREMAGY